MGEVVKKINPDVGIKMDVIELIAEGDKVVARVKGSVEGKYGPYNNTYCHVFTVRDGLIVENFEHMDTVLVERALYGRKLIETETH
jgi:ketosteroid isomerase-like protein